MLVQNVRDFPQSKLDSEINVPFLLKKHGDLYFLLHKNIVHIIHFNFSKIPKKLSEGNKDIVESVRKKPFLQHANYDQENNNSTNALRPRRFKWCDLSPNFIRYCSIWSTLSTCQFFSQVLLK